MRRNKEFTIGIAVATLFVILVWLVVMFGKQSFPTLGEEYSLFARFNTAIPGIDKNTPVNMNGIKIGRVASVELVDEDGKRHAVVKLLIRKQHKTYGSDECRISSLLLNLSGNISLEIVQQKNYKGPPAVALRDGDEILGAIQSDISQTFGNLEGELTTMLQNISSTTGKFETFIDSINAVIGTPSEAREKQQRFQEIIDKTGEMMYALNLLADNINALLSDGDIHENIRSATEQFPDTLLQIRNSLDNFNAFSRESRMTLTHISQTFDKAETNLDLLQNFTEALGEEGPEILKSVARTSQRLEGVFNDISSLMNALKNPDGSLGQLINNPELYSSIQQTIANVEDISEVLKPIVSDFRVFSDKLARDPGVIGVRGLISPASPLKGLPFGRPGQSGVTLASHQSSFPGSAARTPIGLPVGRNGILQSSCLSFEPMDSELEMIQRQNLVQRALNNASQRQRFPRQIQFQTQPFCADDGFMTGGEMMDGSMIYEGQDGFVFDSAYDNHGMTPSIPAPQIGSQLVTPPQPMVAPVPLLTAPQPATDQFHLPTTILEFGLPDGSVDSLEWGAGATVYPTGDRGYILEWETELPQPAPPEIQFAQTESNPVSSSQPVEEESDLSAYAPQKIIDAPSPVQSQIKPQPVPEPSVPAPQYGSVRRGIGR